MTGPDTPAGAPGQIPLPSQRELRTFAASRAGSEFEPGATPGTYRTVQALRFIPARVRRLGGRLGRRSRDLDGTGGTAPRALSPRVAARRRALAIRLWVAASIWSVALVVAAVVVPSSGSDTSSDPTGLTLTQSTLAQSRGLWAVVLIAVPMLACAVVAYALVREQRERWRPAPAVAWTAIGILTAESLLGILGVGAFMLPVAILLALAVRLTRRATPAAPATQAAPGT